MGKAARTKKQNRITSVPKLKMASPTRLVKLDLACGQNVKEGFEGVDIVGNEKLGVKAVDLWKFPWPWEDNSVDEIYCSHHVEHIPAREVEERDLSGLGRTAHFVGQDMLFAFMDECWRILKHDAWMTVICPAVQSDRAFWDPTHRRFFDQVTFLYFSAEWRKVQGLDHYRARCNFGVETGQTMPQEEAVRAEEVQRERFRTLRNVIFDWIAKMKCIKPTQP